MKRVMYRLIVGAGWAAWATTAGAQSVYLTERTDASDGWTQRIALYDGATGRTTTLFDLPAESHFLIDVAVDEPAGRVFWSQNTGFTDQAFICSVDLHTARMRRLFEIVFAYAGAVYVDTAEQRVYFGVHGIAGTGRIMRMGYDGNDAEAVYQSPDGFTLFLGFVPAFSDGCLFVNTSFGVERISLRGDSPVRLTGLDSVAAMVADEAADLLYFTNLGTGGLWTVDYNGENLTGIPVTGMEPNAVRDLGIDSAGQALYWPEMLIDFDGPGRASLKRLDLATLSVETLFQAEPFAQLMGLAVAASPSCPGDIDGDRDVDLSDLGVLLAAFGCTGETPCAGDADGDGDTDLADLGIVLASFGAACG